MKYNDFIESYIREHQKVISGLSQQGVSELIQVFENALNENRQIFVCGNGGSAANASHFITDLSKGASDALGKRFRGISLNDNSAWLTALGNDYSYDDVFVRQLMNFAQPKDILMVMSVSGNSPNLIKAVEWAKQNEVFTIALLGGNQEKLSNIADLTVTVKDTHYGRVEDAHMGICHIICYAFMEKDA